MIIKSYFLDINYEKPVRHPGGDFEKLISQQARTRGEFGAGK